MDLLRDLEPPQRVAGRVLEHDAGTGIQGSRPHCGRDRDLVRATLRALLAAQQRAGGGEIDVLEYQPGEQAGDAYFEADGDPLHARILVRRRAMPRPLLRVGEAKQQGSCIA